MDRGDPVSIADDDVQSRRILDFPKLVIDLESQSGAAGTVLTRPLR